MTTKKIIETFKSFFFDSKEAYINTLKESLDEEIRRNKESSDYIFKLISILEEKNAELAYLKGILHNVPWYYKK